MRRVWVLAVAVLCACNTPMKPRVGGKPGEYETPESLRPSVDRAVTIGRELFEFDLVSARATDVLRDDAQIDPAAENLSGWITFKQDDHYVVQFVKVLPDGTPAAAYEILFQPGAPREAGMQKFEPPVPLEARVAAMFRARLVVLNSMKEVCGGPNPVVLPASRIGKTGWLVYVLAGTTHPDDFVVAGHRLFRVSPDGSRIEEELTLTRTCMIMRHDPARGELVAPYVNYPFGPTPHEGHVFSSLLYRIPMFVVAEGKLWKVEGQDIVFMGVP